MKNIFKVPDGRPDPLAKPADLGPAAQAKVAEFIAQSDDPFLDMIVASKKVVERAATESAKQPKAKPEKNPPLTPGLATS